MTRTAERGNLEWIIGKVAETLKVDVAELRTANSGPATKENWQVAAYAAYTLGNRNVAEIGAALGGADHAHVLVAREMVEARMAANPMFRLGVQKLLEELSIAMF